MILHSRTSMSCESIFMQSNRLDAKTQLRVRAVHTTKNIKDYFAGLWIAYNVIEVPQNCCFCFHQCIGWNTCRFLLIGFPYILGFFFPFTLNYIQIIQCTYSQISHDYPSKPNKECTVLFLYCTKKIQRWSADTDGLSGCKDHLTSC